ncbi:MAG: hypothetical protein ACRC33_21085 [Gemmataceae bacterium]
MSGAPSNSPGWLFEVGRHLMEALERWWKGVKEKRHRVAVLGIAGGGKTTLAAILTGGKADLHYRESIGVDRHQLGGESPYLLLVGPGQDARRAKWDEVIDEVKEGETLGLIHVVSYGHQTVNYPLEKHGLYKAGMTEKRFFTAYAKHQKDEEIKALEAVTGGLKAYPRKVWMMTLVTKEDLWAGKRDEVRRHYEEGTYAETVRRLGEALGAGRFHHEFVYASLVILNLKDSAANLRACTTVIAIRRNRGSRRPNWCESLRR